MPVENIHQDGSLMFNKMPEGGVLADCYTSVYGDIHEDEDFDEADIKAIKDKDDSVKGYWRYLTDSQAKNKLKDRQELEDLASEADAQRAGVQPGAFLDSTGPDGDETIEEKMKQASLSDPFGKKASSKTAPNKAADSKVV